MPDPTKRTGTGENKPGLKKAPANQQATPVKKTYTRDANGKIVTYGGVVYNDDKTKKTPPPADTKPRSMPRFNSEATEYIKEVFDHTMGKPAVKKKGNTGRAVFE